MKNKEEKFYFFWEKKIYDLIDNITNEGERSYILNELHEKLFSGYPIEFIEQFLMDNYNLCKSNDNDYFSKMKIYE